MYTSSRHTNRKRTEAGFTLIELIIVLMIASVLMGLAVPAFNNTIRDNRVVATANNLVTGVGTARAEAIRRGRLVSICPSADGLACVTDWSVGWMVYVEKDTVKPGDTPKPDTVLQVGESTRKTAITSANSYIRFTPRGLTEAAVTLKVAPSVCDTGVYQRELSVGAAGRVSITKTKTTCP